MRHWCKVVDITIAKPNEERRKERRKSKSKRGFELSLSTSVVFLNRILFHHRPF